jgi:hypothetical protein
MLVLPILRVFIITKHLIICLAREQLNALAHGGLIRCYTKCSSIANLIFGCQHPALIHIYVDTLVHTP